MAKSQQSSRTAIWTSTGAVQLRPEEILGSLTKFRSLAGLPRRSVRALAQRMTVRYFAKNSFIHHEEQAKQHVYVLLSGIGRLTCLNRKEVRILLEVLGPGDVVGIPSLLPDLRQNLRCEAFTDCQVGRIAPKTLVEDVIGVPFEHFRHALMLTSGRWWQLLLRHSTFIEQSLQERVIFSLLELGSKVGVADVEKNTISIDLTHRDLAHLVMGSRAKVSGCLVQLAARNAIVQESRTKIVIVDPAKLRAIAGL